MKQETLEEFINKELEGYDEIDFSTYERFIELGAKWQQEQDKNKYSEEDMEEMYNYGYNNYLLYSEAIHQFKKL
jgi:hypothetical protein